MNAAIIKKTVVILGVVNLVALNFVVGYIFYIALIKQSSIDDKATLSDGTTRKVIETKDECGEECRRYIDLAVSNLETENIEIAPTAIPVKITVVQKIKTTSYYPIPGDGETRETAWIDLAGTEFYFDKKDFSGFKEAYLELNVKLSNGSGEAYFRLFDVTHGIAVNGSEIKTSSAISVALSTGNISVWEGRNLYRVQARSLTSESAVFETGRLRIVSEN